MLSIKIKGTSSFSKEERRPPPTQKNPDRRRFSDPRVGSPSEKGPLMKTSSFRLDLDLSPIADCCDAVPMIFFGPCFRKKGHELSYSQQSSSIHHHFICKWLKFHMIHKPEWDFEGEFPDSKNGHRNPPGRISHSSGAVLGRKNVSNVIWLVASTNPFEKYDRQNGFIFPNFPQF